MATHPHMSDTSPPRLRAHTQRDSEASDSLSLRNLVETVRAGKWFIAGCALLAALAGGGYAILATPVYESQALVQVEGHRGSFPGFENLSGMREDAARAETELETEREMEILRSRLVLGAAVDELNLQVTASPARFPVIGGYWARRYDGEAPAPARFGKGHYGWGGERVQVERFDVGEGVSDDVTLEAGAPGAYTIYASSGERLLEGEVGELARSQGEPPMTVLVTELEAAAGTRFELSKVSRQKAVRDVRRALTVRASRPGTGILDLTYESEDPKESERVLSAVVDAYVRQHIDRRAAQARKGLEFLEDKLPELREQVEEAEEAYNEFRRQNQVMDLGAEPENLVSQIVEVERELGELEMRRLEKDRRFTAEHPEMQTLDQKIRRLEARRDALERRADGLPGREQQAVRLRREVDVATELYASLQSTAQELRVAEAGTIGNVRVLDSAAVPEAPVRPQRLVVSGVSTAAGLLFGFGLAFVRRAVQRSVQSPEVIEEALGIPVYGVLPHSAGERRAARRGARRRARRPLLAASNPADAVVESFRSFRTTLHFGLLDGKTNAIAFTSPHATSGTSFVSMNVGHVFAESGTRVLVIDADLRAGSLHTYVGCGRSPGLAEVLAGETALGEAVRDFVSGDLASDTAQRGNEGEGRGVFHVLTSGALPADPSERLMGGGFARVVSAAKEQYDLVVIDTPPALAVTDAAVVGACASSVFMVVRAGRSQLSEIEAAQKRLRQGQIPVTGVVFDDAGTEGSR